MDTVIPATKGPAVAATSDYDLPKLPVKHKGVPIRRQWPKIGRNQLCPCGSGLKFKRCHGQRKVAKEVKP